MQAGTKTDEEVLKEFDRLKTVVLHLCVLTAHAWARYTQGPKNDTETRSRALRYLRITRSQLKALFEMAEGESPIENDRILVDYMTYRPAQELIFGLVGVEDRFLEPIGDPDEDSGKVEISQYTSDLLDEATAASLGDDPALVKILAESTVAG